MSSTEIVLHEKLKKRGFSGKQKNSNSAVICTKYCLITGETEWARVNEFIPRLTVTQKATTCLLQFKKQLKMYRSALKTQNARFICIFSGGEGEWVKLIGLWDQVEPRFIATQEATTDVW